MQYKYYKFSSWIYSLSSLVWLNTHATCFYFFQNFLAFCSLHSVKISLWIVLLQYNIHMCCIGEMIKNSPGNKKNPLSVSEGFMT